MSKWVVIAAAGAAGTLARYALSGVVQRWGGASFPWGTLAVNAVGCLLFGVLAGWMENRLGPAAWVRPYAMIGFLGAFTTFSTFAYESAALTLDREWTLALINAAGQTLLGVVLVVAGLAVGRAL